MSDNVSDEQYFEGDGNQDHHVADISEMNSMLDAVVAFLGRFVVTTEAQAVAVALWIAHTHVLDSFEQTPYLAVTSAEKRSGKSRLFDVLELLVARPWKAITPTEAVVFRKIEADKPTLLLDEVDAIFGPKAREHEGLRAVLNAGNRKGTKVPRCVGPTQELRNFSVFCAKALAGIGDLPDTVADRSIRIRLKRKAPDEVVKRFYVRDARELAEPLYQWLLSWADRKAGDLDHARPSLPAELNDRAADSWEPLLAIADLAGGEWGKRARAAALDLSAHEEDERESLGIRLLADLPTVFGTVVDKLSSTELCEKLAALEESPWGDWRGKPLEPRGLSRLLRPYGIKSEQLWIEGKNFHGYTRERLEDAWNRYLAPETPSRTLEPLEPASEAGSSPVSGTLDEAGLADTKSTANPYEKPSLAALADKAADSGNEAENERLVLAGVEEAVANGVGVRLEDDRPRCDLCQFRAEPGWFAEINGRPYCPPTENGRCTDRARQRLRAAGAKDRRWR